MRKWNAGLLLVAGIFFSSFLYAATAEAWPKVEREHFILGDVEVFSIQDLATTMDISLFSGPASEETRKKYMPGGSAKASVNVFAVKIAGKILLIDAGYGFLNSGSGMITALTDFRITPQMVDQVLLTHMHPDHIGGLILNNGERFFPKAELWVSAEEYDFWVKNKDDESLPVTVAKAYGKDLKTFEAGEELAPKITAIAAPGHTPGHTVFLMNAGKSLLFIGDTLHAAALQFPLPDECAKYDQNPEMAARARKAVLFLAAANRIPVAGAHIPFPGVGRVEIAEGGGFVFREGLE